MGSVKVNIVSWSKTPEAVWLSRCPECEGIGIYYNCVDCDGFCELPSGLECRNCAGMGKSGIYNSNDPAGTPCEYCDGTGTHEGYLAKIELKRIQQKIQSGGTIADQWLQEKGLQHVK